MCDAIRIIKVYFLNTERERKCVINLLWRHQKSVNQTRCARTCWLFIEIFASLWCYVDVYWTTAKLFLLSAMMKN